ncbi:MAG: ATP phosphoribosyltransferase regulatory subunit [Spirochaetales bacterium]|nr:ATP phosphoribosyltransferase regulatory subunit [Spirochaetales bacterium]
MSRSKMLYKLPQGTERLLLEDALRRQRVVRLVQDTFQLWGYGPVQTPVIDFYDLYAPFLPGDDVYRLVDREGELLMLRSDITLFLARSVGTTLREGHTPLRLCYADTILRHQDAQDISENEFFQVGAEFIGSLAPDGDLEMLLLLDDILERLGLEAQIHLGSRAVFDQVVRLEGLQNESDKLALQKEVLFRRPGLLKGDLKDLFSFVGTHGEARALLSRLKLDASVRKAAEDLVALAETLVPLALKERFRVDFSEIGQREYYTGLVFQAYLAGVGDAFAAGGRYDSLLGRFGLASPSVGFSLSVRKIEPYTTVQVTGDEAVVAPGSTWKERLTWARRERAAGRVVTLGGAV